MGLLITIAVLAILFLIALKLFTVKKVVVEGNELYDQKTISLSDVMITETPCASFPFIDK